MNLDQRSGMLWLLSLAELCEILLRDFDVSPEQCHSDVKAWLAIALEKQVVIALDS
jgi:hypothetical protein